MKKTIYTLNVNNYEPEIRKLTLPYLKMYAERIGAELVEITERKFPDFPVVYEKFQIHELAKKSDSDWFMYFDADALIHPETIDFTNHMSMSEVGNNNYDVACVRFDYDDYFRRDGRNIGCGNWLAIGSKWCLDLWKPLDDMTFEEAVKMIHPTNKELNGGIVPSHLIDDFVMSRNIAKYGLKHKTVQMILEELKLIGAEFFYHDYAVTAQAKIFMLEQTIKKWRI